jgi:hypothetical protein
LNKEKDQQLLEMQKKIDLLLSLQQQNSTTEQNPANDAEKQLGAENSSGNGNNAETNI